MTSDKLMYKYFSFTDEALDGLRKNYIWLSKPSDFNDPFDCYPDLLHFKLTKENYSKMIESNPSLAEFPIAVHTSLTQEEENRLNGILREETKKIYQNFGICCFSKKHDDILMWSHYSDKHKGFCLGFNCFDDPKAFASMPVKYKSKFTSIEYFEDQDRGLNHITYTKAINWKYEQELRVFKNYNGKQNYNKNALREIIFGWKTRDSDKKKLIEIVKTNGYPNVIFKQIMAAKNEFDLTIEDHKVN